MMTNYIFGEPKSGFPKSADLNLIEQIWAEMIKKGRPDRIRHRTRQSLLDNALLTWEQLRLPEGQALTQSLVASMPSRLNDVIGAGGAYTGY